MGSENQIKNFHVLRTMCACYVFHQLFACLGRKNNFPTNSAWHKLLTNLIGAKLIKNNKKEQPVPLPAGFIHNAPDCWPDYMSIQIHIFRYIVGIIFNAIVVYYKYYHRVLYYREGLPIVMQCICCCVRISVPLFYVWQSVSLQITMLLFWIIWQMHENAHSSLISPKSAFTIRSTPPTKIEKPYLFNMQID